MDHLMITLYNTADDEGEDNDDDEDACENDAIQALINEESLKQYSASMALNKDECDEKTNRPNLSRKWISSVEVAGQKTLLACLFNQLSKCCI